MDNSPSESFSAEQIISQTEHWLEKAVIGLNLCPFAKAVHRQKQIRFQVSAATTEKALLLDLRAELQHLIATDISQTETTLLIHPQVLHDFYDFNNFLGLAETLLTEMDLEGEIQLASFHPFYQFAGTAVDALENNTNRSPFPTLHLLRETSIDRAVATYPETDQIYKKNIETMNELGLEGWEKLKTSASK